jgi:hypothetical protein
MALFHSGRLFMKNYIVAAALAVVFSVAAFSPAFAEGGASGAASSASGGCPPGSHWIAAVMQCVGPRGITAPGGNPADNLATPQTQAARERLFRDIQNGGGNKANMVHVTCSCNWGEWSESVMCAPPPSGHSFFNCCKTACEGSGGPPK